MPEGWYAPVCVPLTLRTMYLGIPFDYVMALMTMSVLMLFWRLYIAAGVIPCVLWWLARHYVAQDEWALEIRLEYLRVVIGKREHLHA